jgi:hypothetical protein
VRRIFVLLCGAAVALQLPSPAGAVPPTLSSVSEQGRHPVATFAAPRADFATIYLASKPDRATDGSFLQENVKEIDVLTDSEIQSGRWSDENQIDPGTYWVMLRASPDFDACYIFGTGTYDAACADGFSNMLMLVVPKPQIRYGTSVTVYRYLGEASLRLTATPLGERLPYRLCYHLKKSGKVRCLGGVLDGYSWNSAADDTLSLTTRNLSSVTTFAWYVGGVKVASRRVRIR